MTILVTGGAGFIGGNFIVQWLNLLHEPIVNIDRLTYAGDSDLSGHKSDPRQHFFEIDIADRVGVLELLKRFAPRAIIHFAAETHVDRSIDGPEVFVRTNIVGTFELLESARIYYQGLTVDQRKNFRFLHVSTDEVFGQLSDSEPSATEDRVYAPNSPYSASKAASDHLVRAYHHTYGLPVLTTHCSNNYGPFQYPEKLIPVVIARALAGERIPIYGDGRNIRDWIHVEDHCSALRLILERGRVGETYNVGANAEITNIELATHICSILDEVHPDNVVQDRCSLITFVTDRPGHDWRYSLNSNKLRSELGWRPSHELAEGLRQTVLWYLANRNWLTHRAT